MIKKSFIIPIVGFCDCSMFCCALLCVHSSLPIVLMGEKDLIVFLASRECCVALLRGIMGLSAVCDCIS